MNKQLRFQTLSISILTAMSISVYAKDTSEDATKLKTIVVTASSQAVDVKEAPASISVITSEDIEKQPEPYRVCRRVNILRDYPDDKIKIYP